MRQWEIFFISKKLNQASILSELKLQAKRQSL